jgi:hypothetical protein
MQVCDQAITDEYPGGRLVDREAADYEAAAASFYKQTGYPTAIGQMREAFDAAFEGTDDG